MSNEKIEYCPWCGNPASQTLVQENHQAFRAIECEDCETIFRVEVPHTETVLKWTDAR